MSQAQRPSPPVTLWLSAWRIVFAVAVIEGGFWLMRYEDGDFYLVGIILVVAMGLWMFRGVLDLVNTSMTAAKQVNLFAETRRISGKYGTARLAQVGDPVIRRMQQTTGLIVGALGGQLLSYDPFAQGNGHMLNYAPSRTAKTASNCIPALLHWFGGSVFVTDVKGEIAKITAAFRRFRGVRVVLLNPFNVLGMGGTAFNPLAVLVDDIMLNAGRELHNLVRLIALQLLPKEEKSQGDSEFFRKGGRREIMAWLLYLASFCPTKCNLPELRKFIWMTSENKRVLAQQLMDSDRFGGLLNDYGSALHEMLSPEYVKTYGAFRDNAMNAVEIYDSHSEFGRSLMGNEFSLRHMLEEDVTLYCILPESKSESHGAWQGLVTALLFETIAASKKNKPLLLLLEEMGNLGKLPNLAKALSLLPGKGCRCWMIFQSRKQPKIIYGEDMRGLIEEQSSFIQQWAIRDLEDQKQWSERIGNTTKKVRSLARDNRNTQAPWRLNVSERTDAVMSKDEIRRMGRNWQLFAVDGEPVVCAQKVPYYQVKEFRKRARPHPYHPNGYPANQPVIFSLANKRLRKS